MSNHRQIHATMIQLAGRGRLGWARSSSTGSRDLTTVDFAANSSNCLVWFPDPSCMGGVREGRKGLVNNSTPTRIHGISLMLNNC